MEESNNSSFLTVFLRYLPVILGAFGIIFLLLGVFFSFTNRKKPEITITDANGQNPVGAKETTLIKVDVEGAVLKPGVYSLEAEARVQEALLSAGGLSAEADREWAGKNLNLAAKLADGAKIYIPKAGEISDKQQAISNKNGDTAGVSASGMININSASPAELDTLPGIGAVTAQKIIDGRPYQKIEDLVEKKIVNSGVWDKIKEKISVY